MSIETVERIIRWVRDVLVIVVCFGAIYLYFQVSAAMDRVSDSIDGFFGTSTEEYVPPDDWQNDPDCWMSETGEPLCAPGGEDGMP